MKKYLITALGTDFDLYSLPSGYENEEKIKALIDGNALIAVIPSLTHDFSVMCFDRTGTRYSDNDGVLEATRIFLRDVRGYPECEVDLALFGEPFTLKVLNTGQGDKSDFEDKSKQLFTNNIVLADGAEITVYTVRVSGEWIRLLEAENIDTFDTSVLERVLFVDGLVLCSDAAVFSFSPFGISLFGLGRVDLSLYLHALCAVFAHLFED